VAEYVARFLRDAGIMRNGFSFQAGAGGIALAFVDYLRRMMKEDGVKARFVAWWIDALSGGDVCRKG